MPAPYSTPAIRNWAPSDWQERLAPLLAYYNGVIGGDAINVPIVATVTARNAIAAPEEGAIILLANAGAGDPALQVYDGTAWQTVWPSAQEGALPVVANIAARDALTPDEGNLVYVQDTGAGGPGIYTYDGAAWQAVWPVAAEPTVDLPVYANTAARDVAVPAPAAGDLVYVTDAGAVAPAVQVHNGATWNAVWPAAAAGVVVPTSLSSLWVNEPGVLGGDTPFVLGDWQDAATTGPNTCGATALALTLQRGCIRAELPSGAARFAAFGLPLPTLADGDEVCFRFLADFQLAAFDAITSAVSGTVFAGFFTSAGADTTWVGAGYLSTVNRIAAPTWGRWASTGPSPNLSGAANLGADSQSGAAAFQSRVFDVRARRVGATTRLYYAIDGGAWMTADSSTAATTANLASGTVRAGIRVATTSATATSAVVTLVAFKHFVGGLPAAIARG
jgi:hypothetical protein